MKSVLICGLIGLVFLSIGLVLRIELIADVGRIVFAICMITVIFKEIMESD